MGGQLIRAFRAFASVLRDKPFLNLPASERPKAAAELDDLSLAKWVRWAMVLVANSYTAKADKERRSVAEITTMHGVIVLALTTMGQGATKGTFTVEGVTYRGGEYGNWRVVIERTDTLSTNQEAKNG